MNKSFTTLITLCLFGAIPVLADENLPLLRDGADVYHNVTVTTVTATDIYFTFNNGAGMANAKLKDLSPELQRHFNYHLAKAGEAGQKQAEANAEYQRQLTRQPVVRLPDETRQEPTPAAPTSKLSALPIGSPFPDFAESDLDGNPISVANFRGKVVLLDFWATWCNPCRRELPNVIATYQKHHGEGFEVIGVSLDQDRGSLETFLRNTDGMTYPQYFDGKGWGNKLAVEYGVESIPFAVLIGPDGKIIGKELRGERLEAAVASALSNK